MILDDRQRWLLGRFCCSAILSPQDLGELRRIGLVRRSFTARKGGGWDWSHELTELVTDPAADGRVVAELRAGYALKGRVVRPAQVRVGRYVEPARA